MKKILLLLSLFCSTFLYSQLNYLPANGVITTGTYTDLGTNGTAITLNATGAAMTFNDDNSSIQDIGFNFVFNGQTFTQFVLNTNGFIKLGAVAPSATNIVSILNTTETNCIAAFNMDLDAGTSPEYRVYTSGSAGSRICTIQFKNVKDYHSIMGQYSNISFQIRLYETSNNIEFIYSTFSPSISPAVPRSATIGIMGNNAMNSVNLTKGSSTAWSSPTFMEGPYTSTTLFNHRNTTLPTLGTLYKFVAQALPANDAKLYNVYTLGKIPAGYSTPHNIQAVVKNSGSTTLTNINVSLNITGANTYSNSKTIASLNVGEFATVTFDAFTPTVAGTNTVTVSVPADDLNTNNSYTVTQTITSNTIGSAYTTTTSATYALGSVAAADFATKFINAGTKAIDQITCYYPTTSTGQPYTVSIYDATGIGATPGATALWTSASQTTAGANSNIVVSPAVSVTGDFFVVISQTGTTTIGYAYEVESPLRYNTFYVRQAAGAWSDIATLSTSNSFRIMVDARFSSGLPISINDFYGERKNNYNEITWNTSCEVNSKGFEIYKSLDGKSFSKINFVQSKATDNNCNNLTYTYTDENTTKGNCYYRLKQIDKDGKATFSKTILIKSILTKDFVINNIYPNPVNNILNVSVLVKANTNINYYIADSKGMKLIFGNKTINYTESNFDINVNKLPKGNYTLYINDGVSSVSKQFIKL